MAKWRANPAFCLGFCVCVAAGIGQGCLGDWKTENLGPSGVFTFKVNIFTSKLCPQLLSGGGKGWSFLITEAGSI